MDNLENYGINPYASYRLETNNLIESNCLEKVIEQARINMTGL